MSMNRECKALGETAIAATATALGSGRPEDHLAASEAHHAAAAAYAESGDAMAANKHHGYADHHTAAMKAPAPEPGAVAAVKKSFSFTDAHSAITKGSAT